MHFQCLRPFLSCRQSIGLLVDRKRGFRSRRPDHRWPSIDDIPELRWVKVVLELMLIIGQAILYQSGWGVARPEQRRGDQSAGSALQEQGPRGGGCKPCR